MKIEIDEKLANLYQEFNKKILSIIKENIKATNGYFKTAKRLQKKQEYIQENYGQSVSETRMAEHAQWDVDAKIFWV